jgi:hypothetical protein
MSRRVFTLAFVLSLLIGVVWLVSPLLGTAQLSKCPPLSPPTGAVVTVSSVTELEMAVNSLTSGTTILIADGIYNLHGTYLRFDVPNVAMRSASGNREAVILDGNYETTEIVQIVTSTVTIADLTLRRARHHPIHVMSTDGGNTNDTLIYNVRIIDPGQQAIKINPGADGYYSDDGVVACSHIELTDAGRPEVWTINGSCYTGGVDGHQAWGWVIRDNVIEGFWCQGDGSACGGEDLSEHAIHFWTGSRDTIVERNVLTDNARGVGFGLGSSGSGRTYDPNPCPGASGYVGHFDGIVRNNFIFASRAALFSSNCGFDCGICLEQACGAQVFHNTVASTAAPFSSIEWRFSNTDADIVNNLVSHNLRERDGAIASLSGNLEYAPLSLFVDGVSGDLHLAATATAAIDQGVSVSAGLCDDDIDGDARPIGSSRDIGADEHGLPLPAAVTDLRVTAAITSTDTLTATLRWTAPADAVIYTLRYSDTIIADAHWESAITVTVPFTASMPGVTEWLTVPVSYATGTVYFALKSQNIEGAWSALSNNALWPHLDIYLPLILKGYRP